ncbi:MAG: FAD-dependent oxidoreductase, partial [Clostridia bacterium]|nr:FAD-dependent oxidoreductase [Clostridia bacterium]
TSTYCYATVKEAPAILASVMFVDNHVGGSFYPAGSTLFLPGKLEKVIEENGGDMLYQSEVTRLSFDQGRVTGVELKNGIQLQADHVIYSGTVWNLYGKLIPPEQLSRRQTEWAERLEPTYPSVVLYAYVDAAVIPEGTAPVEMLAWTPEQLDENEVTAYIFSIDDQTLCLPDGHVVMAIGPSLKTWSSDPVEYRQQKDQETRRMVQLLGRRFPGFDQAVRFAEVATPRTIERYTLKNGGAVAGPKQMLGQHMFKRLHTRSDWPNLYCCGESTVMGTGTPTVTTSGLSVANVILQKTGRQPFVHEPDRPNVVRVLPHPVQHADLYSASPEPLRELFRLASRCQFCEHPTCS